VSAIHLFVSTLWLWFDLIPELVLFIYVLMLFYNKPLLFVLNFYYSFVAHVYFHRALAAQSWFMLEL